MKIETQGGIGIENELTEQDIREADGIIIAADRVVNKDRFIGKNCWLSECKMVFVNQEN